MYPSPNFNNQLWDNSVSLYLHCLHIILKQIPDTTFHPQILQYALLKDTELVFLKSLIMLFLEYTKPTVLKKKKRLQAKSFNSSTPSHSGTTKSKIPFASLGFSPHRFIDF